MQTLIMDFCYLYFSVKSDYVLYQVLTILQLVVHYFYPLWFGNFPKSIQKQWKSKWNNKHGWCKFWKDQISFIYSFSFDSRGAGFLLSHSLICSDTCHHYNSFVELQWENKSSIKKKDALKIMIILNIIKLLNNGIKSNCKVF